MQVDDVLGPLWLAPFLARWTEPGRAVRHSWTAVSLSIGMSDLSDVGETPGAAIAAPFANRVEIALLPAACVMHPMRQRGGYLAPDDAWRALQALEHRTYVPASAHSRLSGAGAGMLDND